MLTQQSPISPQKGDQTEKSRRIGNFSKRVGNLQTKLHHQSAKVSMEVTPVSATVAMGKKGKNETNKASCSTASTYGEPVILGKRRLSQNQVRFRSIPENEENSSVQESSLRQSLKHMFDTKRASMGQRKPPNSQNYQYSYQ